MRLFALFIAALLLAASHSSAQSAGDYLFQKKSASGPLAGVWITPAGPPSLFGYSGSTATSFTLGDGLSLSGSILSATAGGLTIGTTTVTGGTNGYALVNNAGSLGEVSLAGYLTSATAASTYLSLSSAASTYLTTASAATTYQPLDSDLTAIAALTTTSFGRELLTRADAAAVRSSLSLGTLATQSATITDYLLTSSAATTYQPLDSGLTALAALADASGVLTNNGSGTLSYTATSTGGNTLGLDAGKIAVYGSNGELKAASALRLTAGPSVMGIWFNDGGSVPGRLTSDTSGFGSRLWTLPNVSGTLITTGDTGSVTNTMLAGSIAISKLAITGTPDGTKYLRDDGTWQTVSSGATLGANTFTGIQQFSGTDHAGLRLNNLTTTQRDALAAPSAGMVIWNTTAARIQAYNGSAWTAGMVRLDGDTMTGALVNSTNSAASTPALSLTGSIFTGGTGTTNTPHVLIQPSSGVTANTGWSNSGTALGIVLPTASTLANFIHLRRDNISYVSINGTGRATGFEVVAAGASGFASYTSQGNAHQENVSGRSIMASVEATGIRLASAYQIRWSSTAAGSGDAFNNNDTILSRVGVGILGIEGSSTGGAIQLREMTAPSAPAADRARMWIEDNGSGKTRLMIQFGSGTAQQIAIEP